MTNTTTYLINTISMTELQHAFVTRCLLNNFEKNGDTAQSKEYVEHLVDVCQELVRDGFNDYRAFECEEDSCNKDVDTDYLEDHEVEALYIGWAITKEEFLTKYTDMSKAFTNGPTSCEMCEIHHANSNDCTWCGNVYQEVADDDEWEDDYQERDDAENVSIYNEYLQDHYDEMNEQEGTPTEIATNQYNHLMENTMKEQKHLESTIKHDKDLQDQVNEDEYWDIMENTMNNFETLLELALIAYLDSGSVTEHVARNLNESEDLTDLKGRLYSYLDSDMITEEFGHNLLNTLGE